VNTTATPIIFIDPNDPRPSIWQDDAHWFDINPDREYRLRFPLPGELPPHLAAQLMVVRCVARSSHVGGQIRLRFIVNPNHGGLHNDDASLCAALSRAFPEDMKRADLFAAGASAAFARAEGA
jgi:hypothetical protein